jgi:hypothetical protein
VDGVDEVVQVAPEAVEFPHDQVVPVAERFKAGGEPGALVASALSWLYPL